MNTKTEQNTILNLFNKLVSLGRSVSLEFTESGAELKIYDGEDLKETLETVRCLGIHEIKKLLFQCGSQYAKGSNKEETLRVFVFPDNETFKGCRTVEIEEIIEIPEKIIDACEEQIIPAHKEIIKKKIIKCDDNHT